MEDENMIGIQIMGLLFALFMMYLTFLHKKRNEFTLKESVFWAGIWIAFIFVTLMPGSIDYIVKDVLSIARTMDFFIIAGFMFLIGISFYTYCLVRMNQRKIERIVRKIAMRQAVVPAEKNDASSSPPGKAAGKLAAAHENKK